MPPKNEPGPKPEEIAVLKAWIDAGAVGPKGSETGPLTLNTPKLAAAKKPKAVTAVGWLPDGKLLAVACFSEVQILNAETQQPVHVIADQPGKVNSVKFSADGRWLLIASGNPLDCGRAMFLRTSRPNKVVRQFDWEISRHPVRCGPQSG